MGSCVYVCVYKRETASVCIIRVCGYPHEEVHVSVRFLCVCDFFFLCESVCVRVRKIEDYLSETNSSIKVWV